VYRTDNFIDNTQFEIEYKAAEKLKSKKELDVYLTKMKPGQQAVYELEEGEMDIKIDETSKYTAWKDGKLVLRRDPMPILLARIERWYNVKFNVLDESINEYTYWVTFEEENLDRVLELLSLTGPIKFEKLPKVQLADGTYKIQEINILLKK
jgi:ferric-dicitrate binding protein FerR (iron transport regulator)